MKSTHSFHTVVTIAEPSRKREKTQTLQKLVDLSPLLRAKITATRGYFRTKHGASSTPPPTSRHKVNGNPESRLQTNLFKRAHVMDAELDYNTPAFTRKQRTFCVSDPPATGTTVTIRAAGIPCTTATDTPASDAPVTYVNIGSTTITAAPRVMFAFGFNTPK